ncbi:MAG: RNA-binding transcriptional accessory protein [Lachnospiraceae bacterium]|nr:RNA-binding transcriptional accessory protein [Lachnospiraceae bacterium]
MRNITEILTKELGRKREHIENVVKLLDEGNTIPFIARYRKEMHGSMDDTLLRSLETRLLYLRGLEERKEEVLRLIEEQGKLTPDLKAEIEKAEVLQRVEDLYKPFKKKRATRASKAKEQGLEPLANLIYLQKQTKGDPAEAAKPYIDPEKEVLDAQTALQGACDIIAENIADDADLIGRLRDKTYKSSLIETDAADPEEKTVYDMYYGRSEALSKIPNHRVLAINRGEKEKKLKVKIEPDTEALLGMIRRRVIRNEDSIFKELLEETVSDSYKRLIAPSIEREMRNLLTERAEADAVKVFMKNTESLLMVPPVKGVRVISIDPGYRTGCKVAVLDETGKLLSYTTIYPTPPKKDIPGTEKTLKKLVDTYGCNVIVIGNGTASRETEEVVSDFIKKNKLPIQYMIVNEAGASVYSASELAAEEYPDLDVTTRGAMSLGRRLQDPLAELVKIDPKHIGVGQYQHDINQKELMTALSGVVENCVNRVGVDLNTASPSLLSYVAGISGPIAKNIVAYREENGRFLSRRELLKVPRLGPKAYEQCAGFLRIADGKEVLDATGVHPESYEITRTIMEKTGVTKEQITAGGVPEVEKKVQQAYPAGKLSESIAKMAKDLDVGEPTLRDILEELKKPARDPREDAPPVIFRSDVTSFEDLKEGMELSGTVRNVVDFGAFVDIGVKQDGLVHISKMSKKYINHPMDVVSIGDTVKVKILSVDHDKKKISLSMID